MPVPSGSETKLTYADYVTWPDDERWELIDGEAFDMTPGPPVKHQEILVRLVLVLGPKLAETGCSLYFAPTDVLLSDHDVVQPDLFVICDAKKITPANIQGAPDLVIELLSPSTALKDKKTKRDLYERFGVREYVIVDPEGQYVERLVLGEQGAYGRAEVLGPTEVLPLASLGDIDIALSEVFEVGAVSEKRTPT